MESMAADMVLGGANQTPGWRAPPRISQKSACIARDRQDNIVGEVVGQFAGGTILIRIYRLR